MLILVNHLLHVIVQVLCLKHHIKSTYSVYDYHNVLEYGLACFFATFRTSLHINALLVYFKSCEVSMIFVTIRNGFGFNNAVNDFQGLVHYCMKQVNCNKPFLFKEINKGCQTINRD